MKHWTSDVLDIAYLDEGPADAPVALMLHGWPDDPTGLEALAGQLRAQGYRTVRPWLRGFGPTRFRSPDTLRDGRGVALAQDAIDLLDGLGIERCVVVGHDWGARAAYHLAALIPGRLDALVALSVGYAARGAFEVPDFAQARRWWYQWLMTTEGGAAKVREDPIGFARIQWDHWAPPGWFTEAEFARAAQSFRNPDWSAITLHGYRSRWQPEPTDPRYAGAQRRIEATTELNVPTLLVVGAQDGVDPPDQTEGLEKYFPAGYGRAVLDGVGHFPAREAPEAVAAAFRDFMAEHSPRQ